MNTDTPIRTIETPVELKRFCDQVATAQWITLDTEFLREKTYYPKLCLLQVATPEHVACIDPLVLDDLSPILDIIYDTGITKVMHAARQDMEIFFHLRQALPAPVFDTQIAALLLGYPDQVGYGTLVKESLGIDLEKLHTRADWSKRPLAPGQIQYAADDVVYLAQIYQVMVRKLIDLGRLDWLSDDFDRLTQPALYSNQPDQAWLRVRGSNRLKGASLPVLQALAGWREELARHKNLPRGWLLRDDALVDIARQLPATLEALGEIRGLQEKFIHRNGSQILGLITTARKRALKDAPAPDSRKRLTPAQDALVDIMMALIRISGHENSLNPAVLASRKQLEQLAAGNTDIALMQGWRKKMVGDRLQALLNGELVLQVSDGVLKLKSTGSGADTMPLSQQVDTE